MYRAKFDQKSDFLFAMCSFISCSSQVISS